MNVDQIYDKDDIGLLPLTDSAKETFLCLTADGLSGNFMPILKYSNEEALSMINDEIDLELDQLSKKDLDKIKTFISVILLKRYSNENIVYDFSEFEFLKDKLSEICSSVVDSVIDRACSNVIEKCVIGVDKFCDIDGYNAIYDLCCMCKQTLSNELDRLDNTYSFSYADDVKGENEDAYVRYNLLLKDYDYFDDILGNGKLLTESVINEYYNLEKQNCSIKKYIGASRVYSIATKKYFDGDINDLQFIRDIYKETRKNKYYKKCSFSFKKNFHKYIKEDLRENGIKF